jgi:tetratricopeptide (TPR) repeat protein
VAVDRDKVLQAAQKLVERKRYDKAIVEYQKLVADDPKDVRTLLKIGDLYLKMEQHVDAITTYERVGQFYQQQGFALKAIAVYKQIREIINKHVPHMEDRFGHIVPKLAEIYAQIGLTTEALAAYDEVATRLQRAGRDRDAIDVFLKVVDLDPESPLPHLRLGDAFIRIKDIDRAIQRFGIAAEMLLKQGRRDDALRVAERLLQYRADPKFSRIAAEIYLERGQPNDPMGALTKLQVAFKDNPKDLDTLALLARAFDKLRQPEKAIEVQKESARIAKEAGKLEQWNALVDALVSRAPNDDGVRVLAAQRAAAQASAEARVSVDIEVDEELELGDDDVESVHSEVAISLRSPGTPAAAAAPAAVAGKPVDPSTRARQIIAQAEAYRRNKDYDRAVAALFEGVEEIPAARELREKLCDLLIEAGDQGEAVRQMLAFARFLGAEQDLEGAARLLDEVLLLEPDQPEAVAMLREFGYAVGDEGGYVEEQAYADAGVAPDAGYGEPAADAEHYPAQEAVAYDPDDPLPAYPLDDIDDPFGVAPAAPRYTTGEEAAHMLQLPSQPSTRPGPSEAPAPLGAGATSERAYLPAYQSVPPPSSLLDEDALEEVDFFASRGMFNEAREMLDEQLARLPNHPLLLQCKRDLEDAMATARADDESGARAVPREEMPSEDRAFDIAAAIDAIDQIDAGPAPASFGDTEQVSVDEVFKQFKEGVAAQISPGDASTHYDLGVAYKEMGLYADAISEFELASRDPNRECVCQSMIGTIHLQSGDVDTAIDSFLRGLHATVKTRDQELALTYEIGECYDARSAPDQALYYFQRVARIDPTYNDPRGPVMERIRRLEPARHKSATRATARIEAAPDELDAALDDLLGGTDLP